MATAPFGGQSQQRWGDNTLNTNEAMRDFLLADLNGKPCMTADARKKGMLLLAFFEANDSSPVLLKALQQLADGYAESGKLTVWAVSQSDEAATRAFADTHGIQFPLLLDRDGYHLMTYGITTLPTTVLADGRGMILKKSRGFRPGTLNEMSEHIAKLAEREEPIVIGT